MLNILTSFTIQSFIAIGLLATAFIAEIAETLSGQWSPLINLGAIGCVLGWFILRAEPRMVAIEAAINRGVRMTGILIIALDGVPPSVREQAREIISELDHKK